MKNIFTSEGLKSLYIYDVENPCKYYRFPYVPTLTYDTVISIDEYNSTEYDVGNYTIQVSWNMWKGLARFILKQGNDLLRVLEWGIIDDIILCFNPDFMGSYFKILFVFDMKDKKRPLYIYTTYDAMEGY